jgi:acyl dehydratase
MAVNTVNGLDEVKALAGKDLGKSSWLEITQERVNLFADATDDHQWIHVDPQRAAAGPFGAPIAHGYLTLSLVIPLFHDLLEITGLSMSVNYGLDKLRFPSPVKVGSKIRIGGVVDKVDDVPGGVQMYVDLTIEVEGQAKPALVARGVYRHYA